MKKVAIIGSRGIPAKYGGFETFTEELVVGLKKRWPDEYRLLVIGDAEQKTKNNNIRNYQGIDIIYSRFNKEDNPILFYFHSLTLAIKNSNIIYSCGTGAAHFSFLSNIFGKKYICNPDGAGWKRQKWSKIVSIGLKSMFYFTAKLSPYIVCDSKGIKELFKDEFNRTKNVDVIEYGAYINPFNDIENQSTKKTLSEFKVAKKQYHLIVSRLEPENNVDIIINGYKNSTQKYPLVIVGNLNNQYSQYLKELSNNNLNIKFIGGIYNKEKLQIIRANALAYYHGHSVGGTNPSLLEAMASRNLCVCHDNIFNREVLAESGLFFSNEMDVKEHINQIESNLYDINFKEKRKLALNRIIEYYNWDSIVNRYNQYFSNL